MCGRFTLIEEFRKVQDHFAASNEVSFSKSYNIAPSQDIPVARSQGQDRELALCQWGLIPHWSRADQKVKPINARAESVADKPFFRDSFRHRRCLIPSTGYYEWKSENGTKQPYIIRLKQPGIFAFAGLWDSWEHNDKSIESCTIITTDAADCIRQLHKRMPVIIRPEDYTAWLDNGGTDLLLPYAGDLEFYPVSRKVNSPANNDPSLVERQ